MKNTRMLRLATMVALANCTIGASFGGAPDRPGLVGDPKLSDQDQIKQDLQDVPGGGAVPQSGRARHLLDGPQQASLKNCTAQEVSKRDTCPALDGGNAVVIPCSGWRFGELLCTCDNGSMLHEGKCKSTISRTVWGGLLSAVITECLAHIIILFADCLNEAPKLKLDVPAYIIVVMIGFAAAATACAPSNRNTLGKKLWIPFWWVVTMALSWLLKQYKAFKASVGPE